MEMKSPRNTSAEAQAHPGRVLLDAMALGTSNAIELQEAMGQRELAASDTLPSKISASDKAILEKEGFIFLGPVPDDPLFQYARFPQIPKPWKIAPTDHSMHSHLVDGKGRKRGGIFYKAAFYDRHAALHLEPRFHVHADYDSRDKRGVAIAQVLDGDEVIHETEPLNLADTGEHFEAAAKATENARAWLKEHFPLYADVAAYWG